MKIVHYAYDDVDNPRCGGGGAFRELALHRRIASRHEITFYTGSYPGARAHADGGIVFRHLGFGPGYLLSRMTFALFATFHSLCAKADVIVIGYSVFAPVLTFLVRRNKTILEFYHLTGREPFKKYSLFGIFPWLAEKLALRYARNFLTLTEAMAQLLRQKNPKNRAVCTYSGFDESMLSLKPEDRNYILYFGRIDIHMKGLDILVKAFERVALESPSLRLKIAGRGTSTDIAQLYRLVSESRAKQRIEVRINVSTEEKHELFRCASFVCMPSRFEGWCISAVEAAACGKATLGTLVMGLKESVQDGETGILVAPEDTAALAEAMMVLHSKRELRERLGEKGHQWARRFTWEQVAKSQETFYYDVTGRADI